MFTSWSNKLFSNLISFMIGSSSTSVSKTFDWTKFTSAVTSHNLVMSSICCCDNWLVNKAINLSFGIFLRNPDCCPIIWKKYWFLKYWIFYLPVINVYSLAYIQGLWYMYSGLGWLTPLSTIFQLYRGSALAGPKKFFWASIILVTGPDGIMVAHKFCDIFFMKKRHQISIYKQFSG